MPGLPAPVTPTDTLLLAVHTELVGLRADLAASRGGETASSAEPGEQVELLEPKPAAPKSRRTTTRGG